VAPMLPQPVVQNGIPASLSSSSSSQSARAQTQVQGQCPCDMVRVVHCQQAERNGRYLTTLKRPSGERMAL